jgi:hypothetical protein
VIGAAGPKGTQAGRLDLIAAKLGSAFFTKGVHFRQSIIRLKIAGWGVDSFFPCAQPSCQRIFVLKFLKSLELL